MGGGLESGRTGGEKAIHGASKGGGKRRASEAEKAQRFAFPYPRFKVYLEG